jgi:hypothetical protein
VSAYQASEWSDLFVATAGASAALAGLVFVAVSINLERILQFDGLPERALETLMMLIGVLLVSVIGLIPGQSNTALGAELLGLGIVLTGGMSALPHSNTAVDGEPRHGPRSRWAIRLAATLPLIVGGLSVSAESGGGLYWIVAAIVLAITGAVANAWVLLVEIMR